MKIPHEITILVDSREKCPLLFPAILRYADQGGTIHAVHLKTARAALEVGDYCIQGYPLCGVVERKGSVREVCSNLLTGDRRRATSAFLRLGTSQVPVLLLDFHIQDFFPDDPAEAVNACNALGRLLDLPGKCGKAVHVVAAGGCKSAGSRRKLGAFVATLLLRALEWHDAPD